MPRNNHKRTNVSTTSVEDEPFNKKHKRGFAPSVADREIISVLRNLKIFDEQGNLKTKKFDVWNEALTHSTLENKIFKDNLYRRVSANRNGILDRLKYCFNVQCNDTNSVEHPFSSEKSLSENDDSEPE